jgi:hypothetical protein
MFGLFCKSSAIVCYDKHIRLSNNKKREKEKKLKLIEKKNKLKLKLIRKKNKLKLGLIRKTDIPRKKNLRLALQYVSH